MTKNNQKRIKNHQKQLKNEARNKKISKMGAWAPKNIQRGPKSNQKWSKTIPKTQKWGCCPATVPRPPSAAPFLCFWDCFWPFLIVFWSSLIVFLGPRPPFYWFSYFAPHFLIVFGDFWLFFVIFIALFGLGSPFYCFWSIFWLFDCVFWFRALSLTGPFRI